MFKNFAIIRMFFNPMYSVYVEISYFLGTFLEWMLKNYLIQENNIWEECPHACRPGYDILLDPSRFDEMVHEMTAMEEDNDKLFRDMDFSAPNTHR